MKKLKDVSKTTGLSRRMIQEYEKSGLVNKPEARNKYGHLQYDEGEMRRLWQLCFYKELGYDHNKIKELEKSQNTSDITQVLEEAIALLEQKKERLDNLIRIANLMKDTEASYDSLCKIAYDEELNDYDNTFDTLCAMANGFEHIMELDDDIISEEFDDMVEDFEKRSEGKEYNDFMELGAGIWKEYLEEDFLKIYDYMEMLGRKGVLPDDTRAQKAIQLLVDKLVKTKITSYKGAGLVLLTIAECFCQIGGDEIGENPNIFKNAIMVYMENNHCEE